MVASLLMKRLALCTLAVSLHGCALAEALLADIVDPPSVTFIEAELIEASFSGARLGVDWRIDNPNAVGLSVDGLDLDLQLDGHALTQLRFPGGLTLPANGSAKHRTEVVFEYSALRDGVLAFYEQDAVSWTARGTCAFQTRAGLIEVPIYASGILSSPRLPSVEPLHVNVRSLSPSRISLAPGLKVHNANPFPIPLGASSLRFQVAGRDVGGADVEAQSLAANGSTELRFPLELRPADVGLGMLDALTGGTLTLSIGGELALGPLLREVDLARDFQLR